MHIAVMMKLVPDPVATSGRIRIDGARAVPLPGTPQIANGFDLHALEAALAIKDAAPSTRVTVITCGTGNMSSMLRRSMAMGADEVQHLQLEEEACADARCVAEVLVAGIQMLGDVYLILCGRQASDTDAALVPAALAARMGAPFVTPVKAIVSSDNDCVIVERFDEEGVQRVEVRLPAVLGISSECNTPRYPAPAALVRASRKSIAAVAHASLLPALPPAAWKLVRSEVVEPDLNHMAEIIAAGSDAEMGIKLAERLHEMGLI